MSTENTVKSYIRTKDIVAMLSISKSTWWLWVKQGKVPKGIKLGSRVTVWNKNEILKLVSQPSLNA